MITSGFISKLRRKYNDLPESHQDIRDGDGSSTVYKLMHAPIKEGSFKLYINNVLQDTSGYTIDQDTGDLELGAATSNEIKSQYKAVKFRDQHWLELIQDAFDSMGDQFFRTTIRSTSGMKLSANVQVYDCPSDCIRLTEVLESDDYTSAGNFKKPYVNMNYDRRSNKLVLGAKPTKANYLQISYQRKLTRPTATSSTLDVENNWLQLLDLHVGAAQARSYADRIAKQGNVSVEEGHISMSHLRQLANDNDIKFENLKQKLKPVMPSISIPYYIHGGGDVN